MRLRRHVAVVVIAASTAVAAGLAGCGVPIDREPRAINQSTVPPTQTVPTTVASSGAPMVAVYFVNGDRLQAEEYPVEGEATLGKALDFVLAAPPEDASSEVSTSVPPGTKLRGAMVADGLATIDLSSEIDDIGGPAQKKAFAQIVFTALGFDEVERVRFLVDGKPVDAPTDDGNLAEVSADDYDPPLNPR